MQPEWGKITTAELIGPIQGKLVSGQQDIPFAELSTDSRKAGRGELFWALKGEKYDGHDFAQKALQSGASGVVICERYLAHLQAQLESGLTQDLQVIITVEDTLKSLGELARWWRNQYDVSVVAVTGSTGKTTTKEMCTCILEQGASVLKSHGNFNNLIGVPLTLLRLTPGVSRVVLEMGMNHAGEIARLTQIGNPDLGVITNVGKVHLEGIGSVEQVARAKTELIEESSPAADMIVNGDDPLLMKAARRLRQDLFTFGMRPQNDVYAGEVQENTIEGISFVLHHGEGSWPVNLRVPGHHNVQNALAAAAVGFSVGMGPDQIVKGLEEFRGMEGRFTIERLSSGITVIDDTYNANPEALRVALETGKSLVPKGGRFLVALGDMLELGDAAIMEHRAAGRLVTDVGAAAFVVLGEYAQDMAEGAKEAGFPEKYLAAAESHEYMVKILTREAREGDIVLFKASRLMGLGRVVELFKAAMERERAADAV